MKPEDQKESVYGNKPLTAQEYIEAFIKGSEFEKMTNSQQTFFETAFCSGFTAGFHFWKRLLQIPRNEAEKIISETSIINAKFFTEVAEKVDRETILGQINKTDLKS